MHIFIDGLDEASEEVQNEISFTINQLSSEFDLLSKFFLSFREDSGILKGVKAAYEIKLSEARLTGDIVSFVEDNVKARINDGYLILQDKSLEGEIVAELISKASGM